MFNNLRNLASKIFAGARQVISNKSFTPPKSSIGNAASGALAGAQKLQASPDYGRQVAERQRLEAAKAAEAARQRELLRQRVLGVFNNVKSGLQNRQKEQAKTAGNWIKNKIKESNVSYSGNWEDLYNPNGSRKDSGGFVGGIKSWLQNAFDPDVKRAKSDWQNWYTTTPDGQYQQFLDKDFKKIQEKYKGIAEGHIDEKKGYTGGSGWFSKFRDKATFGQDRRAGGAREFSQNMNAQLQEKAIARYEQKYKDHQNLVAQLNADFAKKQAGLSLSQQKALANQYQQKALDSSRSLATMNAQISGMMEGYGNKSQEKLSSVWGKGANLFNRKITNPIKGLVGNVWKYTLGEGTESKPSLVTAPARISNWLGNLNTNDRTIYKTGGDQMNRLESNKTAWQATFNQRNQNIRPYVDKAFDREAAIKKFGARKQGLDYNSLGAFGKSLNGSKYTQSEEEYEKYLRKSWDAMNKQARLNNSLLEQGVDPLNVAGFAGKVGAGIKGLDSVSALGKLGRESKIGSGFFKVADKAGEFKGLAKTKANENKLLGWLKKEHKSPIDEFKDSTEALRNLSKTKQDDLFKKLESLGAFKSDINKFDSKLLDDISKLSEHEIRILQNTKGGQLALRDRLRYMGKSNAAARQGLEDKASRWTKLFEKTRKADEIKASSTRFGGATKKFYSPRSVLTSPDREYDFRKFKKYTKSQTKDDLLFGAKERLSKSKIQDLIGEEALQNSNNTKSILKVWRQNEIEQKGIKDGLLKHQLKYERKTTGLNKYRKTPGLRDNVSLSRALFNSSSNLAKKPMKLWKKSVLTANPSWSVNNAAYNIPAAGMAGGKDALIEQAKMLRPKYYKKAMSESRAIAGSNLGKEIGGGRFARFNTALEDFSRVGAYRGGLKKGLSEEKALKRTNKYLFDYKTKNYERPIKAVMPFYQFQKNLAKVAVSMPLDRPMAAKMYNLIDRKQTSDFSRDFKTIRQDLEKQGYSDDDINTYEKELSKIYGSRLKIGGKYYNTPFNVFSSKGMSGVGANPYLGAADEFASATNYYGGKEKGRDASLWRRVVSKFPQAELGRKAFNAHQISSGKLKPVERWIGKPGSEGFGQTKEKQGYDKNATNYDQKLDARAGLNNDAWALFGKPRGIEWDKPEFVQRKLMQKVKEEYFGTDWRNMSAEEQITKRDAMFKKYGVNQDDFFKGELAKYDTSSTKNAKALKEEAYNLNKKLFSEYQNQPYGTRSTWAVDKLKELNKSNYFAKNPYLKSFDWLSKDTVDSVARKKAYQQAKFTGNWKNYKKNYGTKNYSKGGYGKRYGTSEKAQFWQKYYAESDPVKRRELLRNHPQYSKNGVKTEAEIAKAKFWAQYSAASKQQKKALLLANPQYDTRKNWGEAEWDAWKADKKQKERQTLSTVGGFSNLVSGFTTANKAQADPVIQNKKWGKRNKAVRWRI